jgi:GTP-binding protein
MLPIAAIVGRPNVGKSTLFNALIRQQKALTHDEPGVTRDRIYGEVRWTSRPFALVDTGGLVLDDQEQFDAEVLDQAKEAVAECSVAILVVDARDGLTPVDREAAALLRASGKPILLAANKVDGPEQEHLTAEFHELGLELMPVSAAHRYNLRELGERIEALFGEDAWAGPDEPDDEPGGLRLAMLGRPNAGKSSIINALIGERRLIVSDVPGTTRDCVDVTLERGERRYTFVDTAGVRKKGKVEHGVERFSVLRSFTASRRADVSVLVVDASQGLTTQDKKLLSFLDKEKTPFILAVNKTDLAPRSGLSYLEEYYRKALAFCAHVPVVYTSALTKAGLGGLLPLAEKLHEECGRRLSTGELNRAMRTALETHQPPLFKGRRAKFYYLTQPESNPPTFVFFVNDPELVKASYVRYLETRLRKLFTLKMCPLRVFFKASHERKEGTGKRRAS